MNVFIEKAAELATTIGGKLILAILILIVGNILIKNVVKLLDKSQGIAKVDGVVASFFRSFVRIGLYALLVILIISILGVPMTSVIAVLTSATLTVGLALQGALSNLAGGIMLLIFKPFKMGDYISAAGAEGTVKEVTLFYTVLTTVDNKRITVPNGSLMNANIIDFSAEDIRRVDLAFTCAKSESLSKVQDIMMNELKKNPMVLAEPAPFARISKTNEDAFEFAVRGWVKKENYWDVYHDVTESVTTAMAEAGIKTPAVRIVTDK
ncbi:MAG: mechanosensitive ion channel [Eubacteriales bacterium]|nr:mechanosensitive ion channel [Eubacteriales bacterium]